MLLRHLRSSRLALRALAATCAMVLASCGGDGSTSEGALSTPGPGAVASADTSGTISAFGSVFVNGQRYSTDLAVVIDDDTGSVTRSTDGLEVGMVVDVKPAAHSTRAAPVADALHLHPLARGFVDASDAAAGSLRVMGQTVQVTGATLFSDKRACLDAATPCTAIAGQSGLVATSGSGVGSVPGSYVTVHGYLFAGAGSTGAQIVATLVAVSDVPSPAGLAAFKAEGLVSAVAANRLTLGGLDVDLAATQCYASGGRTACASAFAVGQIVSVFAATSPGLPAASFAPTAARARGKLMVETAGAAIELEGKVSAVSVSPAAFSLRGVAVDASSLPAGTALPAVGDVVRVAGTVGPGGQSVVASTLVVLQAAGAVQIGIEGDAGAVAPGAAPDSFTVQVLGKTVQVNAATRLVDLTRSRKSREPSPAASAASAATGTTGATPFNITTFASYLAASASKHLALRVTVDATGQLTALSLAIVPASAAAGVGGKVDAVPVPVNSPSAGAPTTFSVGGLAVSADPTAIVSKRRGANERGSTIAVGDFVIVRGRAGTAGITVAGSATPAERPGQLVLNYGPPPQQGEHDGF